MGFTDISQLINKSNPVQDKFKNLGDVISEALTLIIYISFVLMLIMMIAGALQYIFAGGNKDRLGAARKRITFALIGFVLVVIAWLLKDFIYNLFGPKLTAPGGITQI